MVINVQKIDSVNSCFIIKKKMLIFVVEILKRQK